MTSIFGSLPTPPEPTPEELTKVENKLKKAHVALMRSPHTCAFSGVILRGKNAIKTTGCPTAYTDGKNKYYGYNFFRDMPQAQVTGVVFHENLHDALLHMHRDKDLRREDARLYNAACDYAINDVILSITDRAFIDLPPGRLWDAKFKGWSARQIYIFLRDECEPEDAPKPPPGEGGQCDNPTDGEGESQDDDGDDGDDGSDSNKPGDKPGKGKGKGKGRVHGDAEVVVDKDGNRYPIGGSMDEHDYERVDGMEPREAGDDVQDTRDTLQQGGILAGMRGGNMPRVIEELLAPRIDWVDALRDWLTDVCNGKDEYTWRKYDRRRLPFELYMPSTESIAIGELIFAIDTSGSINNHDLSRVAGELAGLCETMHPTAVRVLWWDTMVHAEQKFLPEQYSQIAHLLLPHGGGGTYASCVSEYIVSKGHAPVGVIVMTDGHLEYDLKWTVSCPTLWVLTPTHSNDEFRPAVGAVIKATH